MQLRILALAAAIALAGCSEDEALTQSSAATNEPAAETSGKEEVKEEDTTENNPQPETPATEARYGLEGPADPLQAALRDQLFAALIENSAQAPEQLPAAAVLKCLDETVALNGVDLIDALAADAAAGETTLTAPQGSNLAVGIEKLLLSTGGLLMSLTGDDSCSLNLDGTGFPQPGDLPSGLPANEEDFLALLNMLQQGGMDGLPLDASMLDQVTDQLDLVIGQIEQNGGEQAAPLVSALNTVVVLLDGVIGVLTLGADDPAAVPGAIESLLTGLAGNLTALASSGAGGFNPDQLTSLLDLSQLTGLFDASPIPLPGADGFDPEAAFAEFTGAFETLVNTLTGLFGSSPIPVPTP